MAVLNKEVRESQPDDLPALEALYAAAFPDENLLPLLRELLNGECDVLSLVAGTDAGPLGHAVFTRCTTTNRSTPVALLGPVAVAPARHGQGIGSAIIRKGLGILHTEGTARVLVLGDPAFYGRLGFVPDACIAPPTPCPTNGATPGSPSTFTQRSRRSKGNCRCRTRGARPSSGASKRPLEKLFAQVDRRFHAEFFEVGGQPGLRCFTPDIAQGSQEVLIRIELRGCAEPF
jgi:putative acetyltransferase